MRILRLGSMVFTSTLIETSYISHVHVTCLPASSSPVLFVYQNLCVTSGSMKALKTSAGGRRISICALATGGFVNSSFSISLCSVVYVEFSKPLQKLHREV